MIKRLYVRLDLEMCIGFGYMKVKGDFRECILGMGKEEVRFRGVEWRRGEVGKGKIKRG